jgi:hypothetical protein
MGAATTNATCTLFLIKQVFKTDTGYKTDRSGRAV